MTAILNIARSQIGMKENPKGSNWGHPVQDYLARVGLKSANPWCMAFMYWCVDEYFVWLKKKNPLPKTAGVLDMWNRVDKKMRVAIPEVGDIFIMDFGGGKGHTGMVETITPDGMLHTIEGNSNDDGSREGYEVVRHTRDPHSKLMKGYIRITDPSLTAPTPTQA